MEEEWNGLCIPCKKVGICASGTVFCRDCRQIYCWNCSKLHKAYQAGCKHNLLPYNVNQLQEIEKKNDLEINTFKFDEYGNEEKDLQKVRNDYIKALAIEHDHSKKGYPDEMFCVKHKEIFCKSCKFRRHSICSSCISVRRASQILLDSGQYLNVVSDLKKCHTISNNAWKASRTEKELLTARETAMLQQIQGIKMAFIHKIAQLETTILITIYDKNRNSIQNLTKAENILKNVKDSSEEMLDTLKDQTKDGIASSSFKTIVECQSKSVLFQSILDRLCTYCQIDDLHECLYESEHSLDSINQCLGSLGNLNVDKFNTQLPSILLNTTDKPISDPTMKTDRRGSLVFGNDTSTCDELFLNSVMDKYSSGEKAISRWSNPDFIKQGIVAINCIDKDEMIALDRTTCSLLLIDRLGKPISSYRFDCMPWGMTLYDEHMAAVTVPGENKIYIVAIEFREFVLRQEIKCSVEPSAITGLKDNIFVTCYPWSDLAAVYKLDDHGKAIGKIERDEMTGNRIFKAPLEIAMNKVTKDIFVCDSGLKTIFAFDAALQQKYKIDLEYMGHPSAMTLDSQGNVFICGKLSNVIYKVTISSKSGKIVYTEDDGLARPQAISTIPGESSLCILCARDNLFKILKIR